MKKLFRSSPIVKFLIKKKSVSQSDASKSSLFLEILAEKLNQYAYVVHIIKHVVMTVTV